MGTSMTQDTLNKFCKDCQTTKPLEMFTKSNRKEFTKGNFRRSYGYKDGYHAYCKECNAKRAKEFRAKHKEMTGNADYRGTGKVNKYPKKDRRLISAIRNRITSSKSRNTKRSNTPFDIDLDYMYTLWNYQKGLCALTGYPMVIDGHTNLRLSIDKIKPNLGYTKGNVQWTIFSANRAKGDLSSKDFIKMCKMIIERATTNENTEKSGSE